MKSLLFIILFLYLSAIRVNAQGFGGFGRLGDMANMGAFGAGLGPFGPGFGGLPPGFMPFQTGFQQEFNPFTPSIGGFGGSIYGSDRFGGGLRSLRDLVGLLGGDESSEDFDF